jgi:hypothetical protein
MDKIIGIHVDISCNDYMLANGVHQKNRARGCLLKRCDNGKR